MCYSEEIIAQADKDRIFKFQIKLAEALAHFILFDAPSLKKCLWSDLMRVIRIVAAQGDKNRLVHSEVRVELFDDPFNLVLCRNFVLIFHLALRRGSQLTLVSK